MKRTSRAKNVATLSIVLSITTSCRLRAGKNLTNLRIRRSRNVRRTDSPLAPPWASSTMLWVMKTNKNLVKQMHRISSYLSQIFEIFDLFMMGVLCCTKKYFTYTTTAKIMVRGETPPSVTRGKPQPPSGYPHAGELTTRNLREKNSSYVTSIKTTLVFTNLYTCCRKPATFMVIFFFTGEKFWNLILNK